LARTNLVPIIEVRYEDLCLNKEQIVRQILEQIGASYSSGVDKSSFTIAEKEKSIHTLVGQSPVLARMEAWQSELSHWQGVVFEFITAKGLIAKDYKLWFLPNTNRLLIPIYMLLAYLVHFASTFIIYWHTLAFYLTHPLYLRNRLWFASQGLSGLV
jgi:hypothetical protein